MKVILMVSGEHSLIASSVIRYNELTPVHVYESDALLHKVQGGVKLLLDKNIHLVNISHNRTSISWLLYAAVGCEIAETLWCDAVVLGWTARHMRFGTYLNLANTVRSGGSRVSIEAPLISMPEQEINLAKEALGVKIG